MQTATGTLATAITAQERQPQAQLLIDWDADGTFSQAIDDQSVRVESIQIEQTLTTDLPDAVDLLAGYSTATATITLSGDPADETDDAPGYYSPYATSSPIYSKRRRWRTVLLSLGFTSSAGEELLPAFTGKTRDLSSNGASKLATLEVLDNFELMRGLVDVPLVIADNHVSPSDTTTPRLRPGLNSSWVVDYLARTCGFHASPPTRTGCLFHATLAGSALPDVGTLVWASNTDSSAGFPPLTFTSSGKFIQGVHGAGGTTSSTQLEFTTAGSVSTNNGGEVLIEGWLGNYVHTGFRQGICEVAKTDATMVGVNKVCLLTEASNDHLLVGIRRVNGGTLTVYDSGLAVPTTGWAYVAVHVYFTSTNISIQWRVNGTTATSSVATSSVTGQPTLTSVYLAAAEDNTGSYIDGSHADYEAWQVANPAVTTGTPAWNDAYVGNSIIQPSLNALTASVPTNDAAATIIQQIAAAELATAGFDETGRFTFYTRNRWTSAPYTASQRTIDASSLKDLTVTESTDQVRNRVRATASPAAVQNAGFVWRTADVITAPASGSTTVTATFDTPATNVDTSIGYSSVNGPLSSYFRTNRNSDGSGTAVATGVTVTVTELTGTTAKLTIANTNPFPVYLVAPAGFSDPQGTPTLAIWGQAVLYAQSPTPDTTTVGVTVPTQTVYDVKDATSIAQHGEQLLEIPVNPWLQDGTSLAALVADLLARLKDPPPVVTGLSIPYDPRLQLGDRITVVADQFGLSADFFMIGSHVNVTIGGGASQTLDTRAV